MIQIKLNSEQEERVEKFCEDRIYNKLSKKHRTELDKWVYNRLKSVPKLDIKFEKYEKNFLILLSAKYKDLKKIKEYIDNNNITYTKKITKRSIVGTYLKNMYIEKIETEAKKRLIKITGVTVCPYCNRNFINVTEKTNTSQLDHFYNKSKYPIFSLCFYNLIPSCYGCNNKKNDKEFFISPYDETIKTEDIPVLTYIPKSLDFRKNIDSFDIVFKDNKFAEYSEGELENEKRNNKKKSTKEKLLLDLCTVDTHNLYQLHKDIVQELFWKNEIYSDSYKERLYQQYGISETEVNRIITGAYTFYDELGKRPLSKLITDISKEIGLLEEE